MFYRYPVRNTFLFPVAFVRHTAWLHLFSFGFVSMIRCIFPPASVFPLTPRGLTFLCFMWCVCLTDIFFTPVLGCLRCYAFRLLSSLPHSVSVSCTWAFVTAVLIYGSVPRGFHTVHKNGGSGLHTPFLHGFWYCSWCFIFLTVVSVFPAIYYALSGASLSWR